MNVADYFVRQITPHRSSHIHGYNIVFETSAGKLGRLTVFQHTPAWSRIHAFSQDPSKPKPPLIQIKSADHNTLEGDCCPFELESLIAPTELLPFHAPKT